MADALPLMNVQIHCYINNIHIHALYVFTFAYHMYAYNIRIHVYTYYRSPGLQKSTS